MNKVVTLGRYSNSQNGVIVSKWGIAPCICGGGKGHDVDKPKFLELKEHEILPYSSKPWQG